MIKAIVGAMIGLVIILLGFYVWYIYMLSLEKGGNHLLFALSLIQIGIGIYVLFWASKSSDPFHLNPHPYQPVEVKKRDLGDLLNRNNEITKEWSKTVVLKDKLKVLQVASKEKEPQSMG